MIWEPSVHQGVKRCVRTKADLLNSMRIKNSTRWGSSCQCLLLWLFTFAYFCIDSLKQLCSSCYMITSRTSGIVILADKLFAGTRGRRSIYQSSCKILFRLGREKWTSLISPSSMHDIISHPKSTSYYWWLGYWLHSVTPGQYDILLDSSLLPNIDIQNLCGILTKLLDDMRFMLVSLHYTELKALKHHRAGVPWCTLICSVDMRLCWCAHSSHDSLLGLDLFSFAAALLVCGWLW